MLDTREPFWHYRPDGYEQGRSPEEQNENANLVFWLVAGIIIFAVGYGACWLAGLVG